MRLVILESPYACKTPGLGHHARAMKVQENINYARACLRDSLLRGEAPIASHLLYTQAGVLDDDVEAERKQGVEAGLAWGEHADASVFYIDRGFSDGMGWGLAHANEAKRPFEFRSLIPISVKLSVHPDASAYAAHDSRRDPTGRPWHSWYTDLVLLASAVENAFSLGHGVVFEIGGVIR